VEQAAVSILKRAQGLFDDSGFHLATADGAFDPAVAEDQHLAAGMARDGATGADDGRQGSGLTLALEVGEVAEE
jgi:hypothetical protein